MAFTVTLPGGVARASSCMFGGRGLATLYITSCSQDFGELASEPLPSPAGALFAVDLAGLTAGIAEPDFAG